MKHYVFFVFLIFSQIIFSQGVEEVELFKQKEVISKLDGKYYIDYYGDIRIIKISLANESYVEYDKDEKMIGHGRLALVDSDLILSPIQITSYSLINGKVQFEIINQGQNQLTLKFFISDGQSETINLQKL